MNVTSYALSIDAPVCRYVDLDLPLDPDCERELSEEERVRASRLHFGIDRRRISRQTRYDRLPLCNIGRSTFDQHAG